MKESEELELLEDSELIEIPEEKPLPVVVAEKVKPKTPLWDLVKSKKVSVFNLPESEISEHVKFLSETPTTLIVTFTLPAIPSVLSYHLTDMSVDLIDKSRLEIKRKY
mgnify:CR=1 FL=1